MAIDIDTPAVGDPARPMRTLLWVYRTRLCAEI